MQYAGAKERDGVGRLRIGVVSGIIRTFGWCSELSLSVVPFFCALLRLFACLCGRDGVELVCASDYAAAMVLVLPEVVEGREKRSATSCP